MRRSCSARVASSFLVKVGKKTDNWVTFRQILSVVLCRCQFVRQLRLFLGICHISVRWTVEWKKLTSMGSTGHQQSERPGKAPKNLGVGCYNYGQTRHVKMYTDSQLDGYSGIWNAAFDNSTGHGYQQSNHARGLFCLSNKLHVCAKKTSE